MSASEKKKKVKPESPYAKAPANDVHAPTKTPVGKEMLIGEVVMKHPKAAEIMLAYGLHCIGCHVNAYESIEQGAKGHGMPDSLINKMVAEINAKLTRKIATIELTPKAIATIKQFQKEDKKEGTGLRIAIVSGHIGVSYDMSFVDAPEKDDKVFTFSGLKVFVPKESYPLLKGSKIDYIETPLESGFRIDNPNAKKEHGECGDSCGCKE